MTETATAPRRRSAPPPAIEPELLTIPEVGAMLGIGRTTVYELIEAGELTIVNPWGRVRRVLASSVRDLIERRIVTV